LVVAQVHLYNIALGFIYMTDHAAYVYGALIDRSPEQIDI